MMDGIEDDGWEEDEEEEGEVTWEGGYDSVRVTPVNIEGVHVGWFNGKPSTSFSSGLFPLSPPTSSASRNPAIPQALE